MRRILLRVLAAIPAVALQALWLVVLVKWLAPWAAVLNFVLSVLALLFVLYLITKQEESTYKVLWLLVILSFPLPGALLYLMFGGKRTTRSLRARLDKIGGDFPPAPPMAPPGADDRLAQTFLYLESITGAALCPNAGAKFYPLGDDLFPDLLAALEQARRYIFLEYFIVERGVFWDSIVEILRRKAAEGVDVRIIMPGIPDKKIVFRMSRSFYPPLLEAGVKIYEYTPGFVHAKGCVVDDIVGTVGTVNLDYRSLFLHFENNALFWNASLLNELKADFLATQQRCRPMIRGQNLRTTLGSWLLDGVLRIISPLC